ncbi:hypothetical protein Lalb_Chr04g0259031 [Lupinus albus]|uniref:Retrovirus-related Pol polyprotein from transposon TNT 1-94-like beta-barrel domain-containing protein n=1 Tax=Lupinus albus TaxID=3870 RepID=A0A6A4QP75_LUPAL|nr:hypothetical protein Lalb_Chr04g0259031 [Lupinus albus]
MDQCYKKPGFPPGYFKNNSTNNFTTMEEFTTNDGADADAAKEQSSNQSSTQSNHIISHMSTQLNNSKDKGELYLLSCIRKSFDWILDTGATDHVCHTLSLFQSFKHIKPIIVTMPNGNQVFTSISGSIMFSKHLVLTDVLYIPSFHYNLIYVSKLTNVVPCRLTFLENVCEIQDLSSLKMIGVADLKAGLYVIRSHAKSISRPLVDKHFNKNRIGYFT